MIFIQTEQITHRCLKHPTSVFNKIECVSEGIILPFQMFEQKR